MKTTEKKTVPSTKAMLAIWGALALVVFLGVFWNLPLPDASERLRKLPETGLFYKSKPIDISPAERMVFGSATVLRREMFAGRHVFSLTVIDGTHNRHAVHNPRHCFQGSGYNVSDGSVVPLSQGYGQSFRLDSPQGTATVLFWFSDGKARHPSAWRYWWQASCRRISRGASGPEPVLVILSANGDTKASWPEILAACPELMNL